MALTAAGSSIRTLLLRNSANFTKNAGLNPRSVKGSALSRSAVTSSSGAVLPNPAKTSFGLTRVTVVVVPFLYLGTCISKNFAALLEEHEIFVPDDDDDD
ncbi:essential MCU regulator, mitochondrial-like [Colossoma macropomum]|uniref:essential MCU regulator, mitochondrial-like n=1 Tax=Colossoma macropomum TaxID=42526 RepID=UPI001864BEE2|nr:essential MCU regulator, mitochondrial-like [Colossoma macropomum]XP_036416781.1 essential MCU regulator, mitochondrial-like [Colossoma macropomum]